MSRWLLTLCLLTACGTDPDDSSSDTDVDTQADGDTDDDSQVVSDDDRDGDGSPDGLDCAPDDASIFPGAPELCDDIVQDCDGDVASRSGTATFFPANGAPHDVTATLNGGTFTNTTAGELRLCGGQWSSHVYSTAPTFAVRHHPDHALPELTGRIDVTGDVELSDLVLHGGIDTRGGSVTAPSATVLAERLTIDTPASSTTFTGTMDLELRDSSVVSAGDLLDDMGNTHLIDSDFVVASVFSGNSPLLYAAALTLDGVTLNTEGYGFAATQGPVLISDSELTTSSDESVLLLSTSDVLQITNTVITSSGAGPNTFPAVALTGNAVALLTDVDFVLNDERGGVNTTGGLTCTDCTFDGAAVHPAISTSGSGRLQIIDSQFTSPAGSTANTRRFVLSTGAARVDLTGSTFSGGYAPEGGGAVHVDNGQLFVTNCVFSGNRSGTDGGAIATGNNRFSSNLTSITDTQFSDNEATGVGGAIASFNALNISGSSFLDNTADGGAALYAGNNQTHRVSTSTLLRNAGGPRGAIYWYNSGTNTLVVTNSNLGTGADDNSDVDVRNQLPANNGTMGSQTHNAGSGASFTCNALQCG